MGHVIEKGLTASVNEDMACYFRFLTSFVLFVFHSQTYLCINSLRYHKKVNIISFNY